MTKKQIEAFLVEKQGYLKKSPLITATAMWKLSSNTPPKTKTELSKELELVRTVQESMRAAVVTINTKVEQKLIDAYDEIIKAKNRPKRRLFFDLEVSPNIVFSWSVGRDISLTHDSILRERAIICVCYKWEGDSMVHSIEWKKGDDKELVKRFAKIIDSADEIVTQNGDAFDVKWLRTRCIHHNVPLSPKFNSLDTLKMARAGFKFNSNKLDYMGKFLGAGGKIKTDFDLWKDITLDNCPNAMKEMVDYCKMDVVRLEQVYQRLQGYVPAKKFKYKIV